jgi:hypothetical protein
MYGNSKDEGVSYFRSRFKQYLRADASSSAEDI